MAYTEEYLGSRVDFVRFLQDLSKKMGAGELNIDSQDVELPRDEEIEFKVKFDYDQEECQLAIKACWPNED